MKKLLFVISQLYRGGAETSLVNLLNNIDYNKYKVELLVLDQSPVENAISLVDKVNKKVTVCDAYKLFSQQRLNDRLRAKFLYSMSQKGAYYYSALDFVRNKEYDWAFFIGEWYNPSFVAYEVNAKIKAAWIHNDLSVAEYFNSGQYFYYADMYDYFVFVSDTSLRESVKAYPFLKEKAVSIYNINDVKQIREDSKETLENFKIDKTLPTFLTCANFREQKNHLFQVEVLAELNKRNCKVNWINIGATTDKNLVNKVKGLVKSEHLEKQFFILGPKSNPYKYMKNVDAVTVLSTYESWSMVITEAKIVGTPVISTMTSGALEQIEDGKTGILVDDMVMHAADKIEEFLKDKELQSRIRSNLKGFDMTQQIIDSFDHLIENGIPYKKRNAGKKNILYVIDDINYIGGAHIATKLQMVEMMNQGYDVFVFSCNVPNVMVRNELLGVSFLSYHDFHEDNILNKRYLDVMLSKSYTHEDKEFKKYIRKMFKKGVSEKPYDEYVLPKLSGLFSKFDIVCVMSEGSCFRKAAAMSTCKKKIQWIHIDYCDWINKNEWARDITKDDGTTYKSFDTIVVLSDNIKASFIKKYPHLESKVVVNANIIPEQKIRELSVTKNEKKGIKFVTVGRIDSQKAFPRLIKILCKLKKEGYNFEWTIIGDGNEFSFINSLININGLQDNVCMLGNLKNPFAEMVKHDVFALLSDFEGIPNTIYEALILGIPVVATNVGGVSTQIKDNETGWLVENNESAIYKTIKRLLNSPDDIERVRNNLKNYRYDNETVIKKDLQIFDLSK